MKKKDKSPYKTHMAASFPRRGFDKHEGAGLYLHIAPHEVLLGGGVYMPLPEDLNVIRRFIADNYTDFKSIVEARPFRRLFGELSGEQLMRVPRGFPTDHPATDYLRRRQFLAARRLEPDLAASREFYKTVLETFHGLMPMIRFLNEPILREKNLRERRKGLMAE